jgi:hypothetical protein
MTPRLRVRRVANGHDKTCPTCGQSLPQPKPRDLGLSPLRTRLFEIVQRAGDNGIATPDLVNLLYAEHPDGGPDSAGQVVRTLICKINKRLKPRGYEIKGRSYGRGGGGEYVYQRVQS